MLENTKMGINKRITLKSSAKLNVDSGEE